MIPRRNESAVRVTSSGDLVIITLEKPRTPPYMPLNIDELLKKREVLQSLEHELMMEWSNFNQGLSEELQIPW